MVKARLDELTEATKADEIMITTMIHDHAARKRSYALLAQAFSLTPPHAMSQSQTAAAG
jgi:hypothetical protein